MNRQSMVATLRTFAADFGVAGLQYGPLCSVLREAAAMLEADDEANVPPYDCSPVDNSCVIDGDVIPGLPCLSCED
jgi:hypothetical protein